MDALNDFKNLKHSKPIDFENFDISSQIISTYKCVAVIGLGGVGSEIAKMLAVSGVNNLKFADCARVELANLAKQTTYNEQDVNKRKTVAMYDKLIKLNKEINIEFFDEFNKESSLQIINDVDLIIDCTDNLKSHLLINKYACRCSIPLITTSIMHEKATVATFTNKEYGCLNCLYQDTKNIQADKRNEVFSVSMRTIALFVAHEAISFMTLNQNKTLHTMFCFDLNNYQINFFHTSKNQKCKVCK